MDPKQFAGITLHRVLFVGVDCVGTKSEGWPMGSRKRIRPFLRIAGDKGVEVLRLHMNTGKFFNGN